MNSREAPSVHKVKLASALDTSSEWVRLWHLLLREVRWVQIERKIERGRGHGCRDGSHYAHSSVMTSPGLKEAQEGDGRHPLTLIRLCHKVLFATQDAAARRGGSP